MPPKAQKRIVVESRETRLAARKQKEAAAVALGLQDNQSTATVSQRAHSASGRSRKGEMSGMSKKGKARREAAAEQARLTAAEGAHTAESEARSIFTSIDADRKGSLSTQDMHNKLADFGLGEMQIEQLFAGAPQLVLCLSAGLASAQRD